MSSTTIPVSDKTVVHQHGMASQNQTAPMAQESSTRLSTESAPKVQPPVCLSPAPANPYHLPSPPKLPPKPDPYAIAVEKLEAAAMDLVNIAGGEDPETHRNAYNIITSAVQVLLASAEDLTKTRDAVHTALKEAQQTRNELAAQKTATLSLDGASDREVMLELHRQVHHLVAHSESVVKHHESFVRWQRTVDQRLDELYRQRDSTVSRTVNLLDAHMLHTSRMIHAELLAMRDLLDQHQRQPESPQQKLRKVRARSDMRASSSPDADSQHPRSFSFKSFFTRGLKHDQRAMTPHRRDTSETFSVGRTSQGTYLNSIGEDQASA
ncbi:hypothetical protein KCU93_g9443, partial [Aureobasidium melanogenum]